MGYFGSGVHIRRVLLATFIILGLLNCDASSDGRGAPITFQAEVTKMLDILINSLYTKREIFLRELISNGSDALDKIRVMYLTSPKESLNDAGEAPGMDIRISFNPEKKQLIIYDGGVGMTKKELGDHLGSLGTSGTKRFLERLQESGAGAGNNNLIGQFGVGFYSVFLVGDKVKVASKSDDSDKQYVWESTGDGQYFLYEDPRGNTLGRGTEITIDVKADSMEFLNPDLVKRVVRQYSEFINFPIYISEKKKVVPKAKANETSNNESNADEAETETEDNEAGAKEDTMQWTLVNENRPIWTRSANDVTEEEYNKFYKSIAYDLKDPMYYSHFKIEGEVEFVSILYVPPRARIQMHNSEETLPRNIKLYVRRVFITDEFRDLLPRYLEFVNGIVDSDDLPLNVSREVLQEDRILRIIRKKLVRKAIQMFNDIAAQDEQIAQEQQRNETNATMENKTARHRSAGTKYMTVPSYTTFWKEFGQHIRMGVIQDVNNRGRLCKLLRYKSTSSEDAYISLQTYTSRMKEGQKGIYYLTGDSVEKIKQSPMLEDALKYGVEVLYMTDAIDEYVVSNIADFEGKRLINLAIEGVQLNENDIQQRAIKRHRAKKYKNFLSQLHKLFGEEDLVKAVLTNRYTTEAFVVSSADPRMTARMANIIRSQTMNLEVFTPIADRVLEVNYRHPLVNELFRRFEVNETDSIGKDMAWVLYDTAKMQAEFPVADIATYTKRVNRLLRSSVNINPTEGMLPEDDAEYLEAIEEEKKIMAAKKEEEEKKKAEEEKKEKAEIEQTNNDTASATPEEIKIEASIESDDTKGESNDSGTDEHDL